MDLSGLSGGCAPHGPSSNTMYCSNRTTRESKFVAKFNISIIVKPIYSMVISLKLRSNIQIFLWYLERLFCELRFHTFCRGQREPFRLQCPQTLSEWPFPPTEPPPKHRLLWEYCVLYVFMNALRPLQAIHVDIPVAAPLLCPAMTKV
jgi:hypothetical protein